MRMMKLFKHSMFDLCDGCENCCHCPVENDDGCCDPGNCCHMECDMSCAGHLTKDECKAVK